MSNSLIYFRNAPGKAKSQHRFDARHLSRGLPGVRFLRQADGVTVYETRSLREDQQRRTPSEGPREIRTFNREPHGEKLERRIFAPKIRALDISQFNAVQRGQTEKSEMSHKGRHPRSATEWKGRRATQGLGWRDESYRVGQFSPQVRRLFYENAR